MFLGNISNSKEIYRDFNDQNTYIGRRSLFHRKKRTLKAEQNTDVQTKV